MTEVNQRVEKIYLAINAFKTEQEAIILRSVNDMKYKQNAKIKLVPQNSTANESPLSGDQLVPKILNTECVLMPQAVTSFGHQKLWPLALTSNRNRNTAEIGNIESQGSLWKLVQRKDSVAGYRVIFQTADTGEVVQYLTKEMTIVSAKADAALWNIKAVTNSNATNGYINTVDPSDPSNAMNKAGVTVQFELVETIGTASDAPSLLVCAHNEGLNRSEAAVVAIGRDGQQAVVVNEDGHRVSRSSVWEVMPDGWIDSDLDFLEGHI